MKLKLEWMSQLRVAAGQARQSVECEEGTRLEQALRLALEQLPPDRASALSALLLDGGALSPSLLIAVDEIQVPIGTDPSLTDGATLVLMAPIAGG